MPHSSLRMAAIAVAAASAIVLAGCAATPASEGGSSTDDGTFPLTIEHTFGETEITEQPENVVTWGWGAADAAIALGVIPVAIPFQAYGGDEDGVLPWIAEALEEQGAETPTILPDSTEEPPYEEILAANPDIILAPYSGITEDEYELLSAIAPTVAYPGEAWSTPWRDVISIVGEALGKKAEAEEVLEGIDAEVAEQAAAHPEFAGKSIAAVWDIAGTFYIYKQADPRVEFLFDLGFVNAPSVDELSSGDSSFFYTLSYEQLDKLESDVVISYSDTQAESDAFVSSSYGQTIPAIAAGSIATIIGTEFIASVSPPTALSASWGLNELVTQLAAATK